MDNETNYNKKSISNFNRYCLNCGEKVKIDSFFCDKECLLEYSELHYNDK